MVDPAESLSVSFWDYLPLPDLGVQLPVDELYRRVEFGQGETSTPPGERVIP